MLIIGKTHIPANAPLQGEKRMQPISLWFLVFLQEVAQLLFYYDLFYNTKNPYFIIQKPFGSVW